MKKLLSILLSLYLVLALILVGCTVQATYEDYDQSDAIAFKAEHEALNGVSNPNNPDLVFQYMYVPESNPFVYVELSDLVYLLKSEGTGIFYLGFPNCPWCRNFVPVMIDAARSFGVTEIGYRNILYDRNILELRDGEIYTVRDGDPYYYRLLEILGDLAPIYTGLEDDSIRRVFVPAVLFVREGNVIHYMGALESFRERVMDTELGGWQDKLPNEETELRRLFYYWFSRTFQVERQGNCMVPC